MLISLVSGTMHRYVFNNFFFMVVAKSFDTYLSVLWPHPSMSLSV